MAQAGSHPSRAEISNDAVLVRAVGAVESEVDGDRVLLSPKGFAYFSLAGTGAAVWDRIDGERSVTMILSELERTYSAERGVIRRETVRFVQDLADAGLVTQG